MLQGGLPLKFQDVKFKDPKFKHEIFVRNIHEAFILLKRFHICLQSIISVVEIIIELFVVCQKLIYVMRNFCSCYIKKFYVLVHRNILM